MDSEFFYIPSIKRFGLARILVEGRLFSSRKLETLGIELSEITCGGTICSASGGDITGREGFSNNADFGGGSGFGKNTIACGSSAKSMSASSQCLGSKSATFEPASSRSRSICLFQNSFPTCPTLFHRT